MKRFDQVNVIPFIDIMLVLLAIVLTTATFISQEKIAVELPEAENTITDTQKEAVKILIDHAGKYFLGQKPVDFVVLAQELKSLTKDNHIVLYVDKSARFEQFIKIIDSLKENQLDNLSIMTRRAHE